MKRVTRLPRLPFRKQPSHKGLFGHVLVVGGAVGMSGAVALAGRAASRGGAGLVTIACPIQSQPVVAALVPEALTVPLPQRPDGRLDPVRALTGLLAKRPGWTVLAAGCGWGTADDAFACKSIAMLGDLADVIAGPAVLDADAINLLAIAGPAGLRLGQRGPTILTPHPGELARLLNRPTGQIQEDRIGAAAEATGQFRDAILVLKGSGTIVTDGRRYYVNTTGNPGLATGGTGDVLTGLIAALLGQDFEPFDAAVLGVHVHGLAGDLAARKLGHISLIAPDLPDYLAAAFMRLRRKR